MRTKKKKKFAAVLTLAMLCWALMVGGPPAFAAVSEDVVVCARQGAQAAGTSDAPMSQSNQGTFRIEARPSATPPLEAVECVECDP
jgi:hypothetical protein